MPHKKLIMEMAPASAMHDDLANKFAQDIDDAILRSKDTMDIADIRPKDILEIHLSVLAIRMILLLYATGNDLQTGHSFIDSAIELHVLRMSQP